MACVMLTAMLSRMDPCPGVVDADGMRVKICGPDAERRGRGRGGGRGERNFIIHNLFCRHYLDARVHPPQGASSAAILVPAVPYMLASCKSSCSSDSDTDNKGSDLAPAASAQDPSAGSVREEAGEASRRLEFAASGLPPEEERALEDALSGLYAAIWSVGELIGTPLGGWLLGVLPASEELNCSSRPHTKDTECSWSFHTTMQAFVVVMLVCTFVMLIDSLRASRRFSRCRHAVRTESTSDPP